MRKDVKEKWVAALRSGEYEQGNSYLTQTVIDDTTRHCCLGVLCELALADNVYLHTTIGADGEKSYDTNSAYLPVSVQEWADLFDGNPHIGEHTAVELNDELNLDFNRIADEIEEHL